MLKGRTTQRHHSGRHVTSTSKVMQEYREVKLQLPISSGDWSRSRHLPLYPKKSATKYPLNTRLGGRRSPSPTAQHAPIPWSPIPQPRRHGIILKCILTWCEDERIHVLRNKGQLTTHVAKAKNLRIRKRQAGISDLPSGYLLFQEPAANHPPRFI